MSKWIVIYYRLKYGILLKYLRKTSLKLLYLYKNPSLKSKI